jgi:hypothetical protein
MGYYDPAAGRYVTGSDADEVDPPFSGSKARGRKSFATDQMKVLGKDPDAKLADAAPAHERDKTKIAHHQ